MPGIVIHDLKAVYWPIPKNACTTLKTYFADMLNLQYTIVHDAPFEYTPDPISGYYNFAIVRHPVTRLYSLFKNKIRPDKNTDELYIRGAERVVFERFSIFHNGMNFDAFVSAVISIKDPDPHFARQCDQIPEGANIFKLEEALLFRIILPKRNSSGEYDVSVRPETKGLIYEHYREDFIKYGYSL